jgi:hypothetical protein
MHRHRLRNGASHWRLSGDHGHYVETIRYASGAELARQTGRLTMVDLKLHEGLRALHVGASAPAVRVTTGHAAHRGWFAERVDAACDRAVEELINGIARVRGVPDRARPRDYV